MPSVIYRQSQVSVKYLRQLMGYKAFDNPKDHEVLSTIIQYTTKQNSLIFDFYGGSGTTAHAVISLNRQHDLKQRNYVLTEMGSHFNTVLKPRLLKAAYSPDWKIGKPQKRDDGISHTIKYLKLESYEDALNNLNLTRPEGVQKTLTEAEDTAGILTEYYTEHMTGIEARGSKTLVDMNALEEPFFYTLKVATGGVGVTTERAVDVIETFYYLLGLRVKRRFTVDGVRVSEGTTARGEKVLVLWRSVKAVSDEALKALWIKENWEEKISPALIYVNGPTSLQTLCPPTARWSVLRTEHEFARLMNTIEEIK